MLIIAFGRSSNDNARCVLYRCKINVKIVKIVKVE